MNDQEGLGVGLWLYPTPEVMTERDKETISLLILSYINTISPLFTQMVTYCIHSSMSCLFSLNVHRRSFHIRIPRGVILLFCAYLFHCRAALNFFFNQSTLINAEVASNLHLSLTPQRTTCSPFRHKQES